MYDIAIIGGGPAGSTLARLIGKTHRVLLVDRREMYEPAGEGFQKCCGGLLAPDAQEMLARQGLALPKEVMVGPQLFVVRTIDLPEQLERYYQRFYINVDREKFDRWLFSQIPEQVDCRTRCLFRGVERDGDTFKIHLTQNGREITETAKFVVGADGGFSQVRRQLFGDRPFPRKYISIQEWYRAEKTAPYFSAIFDRDVTDFYSWTIPKDEHLILGAALELGGDAHRKFVLLKEKLIRFGFKFGERVKREGAWILRPVKTSQICTGSNGVALVGEAAGWISPSSAEGFSYALRSAENLAGSLQSGSADICTDYARRSGSLTRNILLKNAKSPFMYNKILRKLALQSGVKSLEIGGE